MAHILPIVLITGASSGIGLALARKLWQSDFRVVATARTSSASFSDLQKLKEHERFIICGLDINIAQERIRVIEEVKSKWGEINILVNNAGISFRSVVEQMSEEDELLQIQTNFISPMELTRLVLPGMRKKRSGKIINVSSVGGMMAMPTMGSYSASKFALEGASEALWYEMRPWNIKVTLVQPGFINSSAFSHVYLNEKAKNSIANKDDYHLYYWNMGEFIEKLMHRAKATSESVAEVVYQTMLKENPPLRVAGTLDAYFFGMLRRILPRPLYHGILYRMLPGVSFWGRK